MKSITKGTMNVLFTAVLVFAFAGVAEAHTTDGVQATSGLHSDEVSQTENFANATYPTPRQNYYVVSANDIGILGTDEGPLTSGSTLIGETFDPESQVGFASVARDATEPVRALVQNSPKLEESVFTLDRNSVETSANGKQTNKPLVVTVSRYTADDVLAATEALATHFESTGETAVFGYDARADAIQIVGELTQADLDAIPDIGVEYYFVPGTYQDDSHNENTRAPFVGGATIFGYGGGQIWRCTSGIPARNSKGTPGYFTAGHCFDLSSHVWTSPSLSGASNSGKVTHRYTERIDSEFVSGKRYDGKLFAGSQKKRVIGTWHPSASRGNRVCFQGSTSGNVCANQIISYNQTRCTGSKCYSNLIALKGGPSSQSGDSGGPVYANFGSSVRVTGTISGHMVPPTGQPTTYVTDWRATRSNYGASLLLG